MQSKDELEAEGYLLKPVNAVLLKARTGANLSQSPEETIELLNTHYMLMFDTINSHGGVVNQMIGDGLMALFGAPLPLDDCAGSAVGAALEMIELIEHFNVEWSAARKPAIRIGIGIATGDVVAGYTGTQQRGEFPLGQDDAAEIWFACAGCRKVLMRLA